MPAGWILARTVLLSVTASLIYYAFLSHRLDYIGHFMGGFGGTLLLFILPLSKERRPSGWETLALVVFAIGLGFITEATIFHLAIFDRVDFANQSLGACLAGACLLNETGSLTLSKGLTVVSALFLSMGFFFAFS